MISSHRAALGGESDVVQSCVALPQRNTKEAWRREEDSKSLQNTKTLIGQETKQPQAEAGISLQVYLIFADPKMWEK